MWVEGQGIALHSSGLIGLMASDLHTSVESAEMHFEMRL